MRVLLTGANGRVGEALKSHLAQSNEYDFTYLDQDEHPEDETIVTDVSDYDSLRSAFKNQDAVVHLAAYPLTDGTWDEIYKSNILGTHNVLEACNEAGVEKLVYASSIHIAGMYEMENAPEVYEYDYDLNVTPEDPERPDSYYGGSKAFGEDWGRLYVETRDYPTQFYGIRLACVRGDPYDNPYGDAEKGVKNGNWERGSDEYEIQVNRLKCHWLSQRDLSQLVKLCLEDENVEFDYFFATSDNERSFYSIDYTKELLGYEPEDHAEEWTEPPEELVEHVNANQD